MKSLKESLDSKASPKRNEDGTTWSDQEPESACQICHGARSVYINVPFGHPKFGKTYPCQCVIEEMERTKKQRLLEFCEMPETMVQEMTFEKFVQRRGTEAAFKAAKEMAEGSKKFIWLLLSGLYGVGKTHLGAAVVLHRINQGHTAKYIYVPDFLDELRNSFGRAGDSYEDVLSRYREVELLMLDDLGTEKRTSWAVEKLDQLIDYRYRNRLELVVTCNLASWDMANDLPRITDRLLDKRICRRIEMRATSYRREGQ